MEKTTRADFIRTLEKHGKVAFCGLIKKDVADTILINAVEKMDLDTLIYTEVTMKSNKMQRKTETGDSSLYFEKGDEVFKHEGEKYIIYVYKSFNHLLYIIQK